MFEASRSRVRGLDDSETGDHRYGLRLPWMAPNSLLIVRNPESSVNWHSVYLVCFTRLYPKVHDTVIGPFIAPL